MTVKELKKLLQDVDESKLVILAGDDDNNDFSELSDVTLDNMCFLEGAVGLQELTKEDKENDYTEDDVLYGNPAIILWP